MIDNNFFIFELHLIANLTKNISEWMSAFLLDAYPIERLPGTGMHF